MTVEQLRTGYVEVSNDCVCPGDVVEIKGQVYKPDPVHDCGRIVAYDIWLDAKHRVDAKWLRDLGVATVWRPRGPIEVTLGMPFETESDGRRFVKLYIPEEWRGSGVEMTLKEQP